MLANALSREAREVNRACEVDRADVISCAAALARRARELEQLPSWPDDRSSYLALADLGVDAVASILALHGRDVAQRAATDALRAVATAQAPRSASGR
jgi:hypothetical protein